MSNLKDVKNKEVKINLGGKERTISINFNVYSDLEDMYGDINTALQKLQSGSIKAIRAFVYAALKDSDESITLKEVGRLMTPDSMDEISKALSKAMEQSMPEPDENEKN